MASHQQPSPTAGIPPHHGAPHPVHGQVNGHPPPLNQAKTSSQYLTHLTESVWNQMGSLSEQMNDLDGAVQCYEQALKFNSWSIPAMQGIACILRTKDHFPQAVEYLRTILKVDPANGEVWGSLGHCYLMMDDLQQAYSAYQQALYHLSDPKEPKLWYGIGILYDRYGSLEHAEEAFSQVMRMEPNFEKANEIYFRLGIIYKQQQKFNQSLDCFKYIVQNPPRPLTEEDIWFQIGHVYEQQKEFDAAKGAYRRVLERDPNHAKVLQQLGWLHHQQSTNYASQEQAIEYLEKSVASDQTDAQSWYLLGRCYMSQQKYPKAYEAYQQAVYRDGRNPTFWCSIGVLYYQINQYRDALDAYSRAIRLNPNISEVWYDLGTLYESCNNQTADALDAYQRAADLDPSNVHIKARLQLLQNGQTSNGVPNQASAPVPQDVHPQAYQPAGLHGPAAPQWGTTPQQPPQGPPPPPLGSASEWSRPLAQIRDPGLPPQQLNPYDQREGVRPPTQHAQRPASPRQEPLRPYQEPPRPPTNGPAPGGPSHPPGPPAPAPLRRGMSPSPKTHSVVPSPYHAPAPPQLPPQGTPSQSHAPPHQPPPQPPSQQQTPQQQPSQPQPPQQQQQQQQPLQPNRISNPNYGPHAANVPPPPPPPPTGLGGPATQGPPPSYGGRVSSPAPEVRPIVEPRAGSPRNAYQGPYQQHHPDPSGGSGIASGAPAPASALAAAEAAAREREDRPPTAPPKRHREWEEAEHHPKPPANDEKRQKLEEPHSRRPSPPPHRISSPQIQRHSPQDAPDARRFNDGYHPSEAAHHPPSLPPMTAAPPPLPRMTETPKQERPEHHEPAARRVDVDENYDDEGEESKPNAPKSERSSPRNAPTNGVPHAPTPVEQKS
ncbi:TPR-like protein [Aaosphaeria arxii CBS 175.79]|uniref:TPR-like protein n=1 Tax=Aaosphaeria arxii CBS 175.79 TaxID=1450172 RepID=A0A6A5XXT0_9PLEO|nr:TPR-like protein [Aaosphaeria arxii CBS 175.79]KAF2017084.1 TPR-like protein [Aaosphaeria arxii CBS 175.79]